MKQAGHNKQRRKSGSPQSRKKASLPRAPELASMNEVRALSALILYEVCIKQKSLNTLLPVASNQVPDKDKALLQELVFGSCRWFLWLKTLYPAFLKKPIHKNDFLVECLLCIGIYQLLFTRIPAHASLNETVEAAEALGLERFKGLINALLRQVSQLAIDIDAPSVRAEMNMASHPLWFREKLKHNLPKHWLSVLEQNNTHPPMSLRINHSSYTDNASRSNPNSNAIQSDYLTKLSDQGISAKASPLSPYGIVLDKPCPVQSLPNFDTGGISVQDEAAQLSSELLALEPGLRVLDACAAPGGKTCAMLEKEPTLSVLALDSDATRATRIEENLSRLNLSADIKVARAEVLADWWDGIQFDRVLLDAPCSATGVIRRHPDIKLLRQEGDIKALAALQMTLLNTLWQTLAPGGLMLYATCSIFPQENNRIIERFLKQTPDAQLRPLEIEAGIDTGFGKQLLPQEQGHDGFFYACLERVIADKENKTEAQQNV